MFSTLRYLSTTHLPPSMWTSYLGGLTVSRRPRPRPAALGQTHFPLRIFRHKNCRRRARPFSRTLLLSSPPPVLPSGSRHVATLRFSQRPRREKEEKAAAFRGLDSSSGSYGLPVVLSLRPTSAESKTNGDEDDDATDDIHKAL